MANEESKGKDLIERKGSAAELPEFPNGEIITVGTEEDLITIAQRRIGVMDKMIEFALKSTNWQHWVNQDGKPYLAHPGAEVVARRLGVSLTNIHTTKIWTEDSSGKYYIYKTTGRAALPGKFDVIEALGTCSQRDKFFAYRSGKLKDTIEIDETNIMKASYSNFVVNAITHLLGLRNMNWENLKAAKIDIDKIPKVEYHGGGEKAKAALPETAKSKKDAIWDMAMQMAAGNEGDAKGFLKTASKFKAKPKEGEKEGREVFAETINGLTTERWISMTYENMKAAFQKAYPGEPVPGEGQGK